MNGKHTVRRAIETKISKFNIQSLKYNEIYKKTHGMGLQANKTMLKRSVNMMTKNQKLLSETEIKHWRIVNGNQRPVEKY